MSLLNIPNPAADAIRARLEQNQTDLARQIGKAKKADDSYARVQAHLWGVMYAGWIRGLQATIYGAAVKASEALDKREQTVLTGLAKLFDIERSGSPAEKADARKAIAECSGLIHKIRETRALAIEEHRAAGDRLPLDTLEALMKGVGNAPSSAGTVFLETVAAEFLPKTVAPQLERP